MKLSNRIKDCQCNYHRCYWCRKVVGHSLPIGTEDMCWDSHLGYKMFMEIDISSASGSSPSFAIKGRDCGAVFCDMWKCGFWDWMQSLLKQSIKSKFYSDKESWLSTWWWGGAKRKRNRRKREYVTATYWTTTTACSSRQVNFLSMNVELVEMVSISTP